MVAGPEKIAGCYLSRVGYYAEQEFYSGLAVIAREEYLVVQFRC